MRHESPSGHGKIYKAVKCELLAYQPSGASGVSDTESKLVSSIERLLSSGTFFFSCGGDDVGRSGLLHRCQERAGSSPSHPMRTVESIFLWNFQLVANMAPESSADEQHHARRWISPLMQGFALTRTFADGGIKHSVSVISRRSVKQAGTRYNSRGIDDEGSVAIFTETECIVTASVGAEGCELFSLVQVRGSVPVFWTHSNSIEVTRNFEMTKPAFRRHLTSLADMYAITNRDDDQPGLVFVNLLSGSKAGESMLSAAMNSQLKAMADDGSSGGGAVLIDFDFHKYVNSTRTLEESLMPLMDTLRPSIYRFGHFDSRDPTTGQSGIFRVNCLDCLDRTNVVQMMIAWEAVMLAQYKSFPKTLPLFKEVFTDIWVRNGDAISTGYSGTASVLSRLVRTAGKAGSRGQIASMLEHSWRSANRFIVSNWEDAERHSAICHLVSRTPPSSRISSGAASPIPQEASPKDLTVWIGTWNIHGRRLDEVGIGGLAGWLTQAADIVVVNLQEVIDLNGMSVLFSSRGDGERSRTVDLEILRQLELMGAGEYVQVANESMVGLYISIFIKREYAGHVDGVGTNRFKAGFGGATGNKGSVSACFRLFKAVEIECVNVHLDSGEFRSQERMNQLAFILENASCTGVSLGRHPQSSMDGVTRTQFISGDFNFRCDGVDSLLAIELLQRNRLERLRKFDPFLTGSPNVLKLAGFREMPLVFPPTYKYNPSGLLSEKRTPSWCDRVFYRSVGPLELMPEQYLSAVECTFSDHKPVFASFAYSLSRPDEVQSTGISHSPSEEVQSTRIESRTLEEVQPTGISHSQTDEVQSTRIESRTVEEVQPTDIIESPTPIVAPITRPAPPVIDLLSGDVESEWVIPVPPVASASPRIPDLLS